MKDIQICIEEHGIKSMIEVEQCSGVNGFDILLSKPKNGDMAFDLIATILTLLLPTGHASP
jgi:hypothetical protein